MALQTDPVATETVVSSWEAYAACMDAAKFAPDLVSDLALPGHAFRPRESCGMYRLIGCLDPHHKPKIQKIKWSCHSGNCRICWRNWAEQRARVISDRLVAGVVHLKGPHVDRPRERRILHVVVSVPPDSRDLFLSTAGRKDLRRQARQRLARVVDGFDGGPLWTTRTVLPGGWAARSFPRISIFLLRVGLTRKTTRRSTKRKRATL